MLTSNQDFRLVSFGQDEVPDTAYAQAERVYLDSIGATARTDTNEIAYWKDRYNQQYASTGDKLYVYGLLNHKEVIGFALVFFFKSHNLVVVDHIAIKEPARNFGSFFYFKNMIAQHLLEQRHQVDFVVAEIVISKLGDPHPVEPQLLIQLLKQSGFKVAHISYFTPSVGPKEYNVKIDAALMIHRNERGSRIASTKLMSLIDCILTDLYLRWYAPHSNNLTAFKRQIKTLREQYALQLSLEDSVELNGNWLEPHRPITPPPTVAKSNDADGLRRTSILLVLLLACSVTLPGIAYLYGLNILSMLLIFVCSLFALLTILAIWHPPASKQADKALKLLSNLLRRDKNIR